MERSEVSEKSRQRTLEELRRAVCLQIRLWDKCQSIDEILPDGSDSLSLLNKARRRHPYRSPQEFDLDTIVSEPERTNSVVGIDRGTKVRWRYSITTEGEKMLKKAFQDAIGLEREIWTVAKSLAETLNNSPRRVLRYIWAFAITADSGMDLGERDLREFLGESDGGVDALGPSIVN